MCANYDSVIYGWALKAAWERFAADEANLVIVHWDGTRVRPQLDFLWIVKS
jgi:hypothetical protein